MMRRGSWIVVAVVLTGNGAAGLQTGRPSSGTATISGVVIDDLTGQPIRHAGVMLSTPGMSRVTSLNADDAGRFRFERVAAGGYVLYFGSSRYVQSQYGASRPNGRGRLIDVADGARVEGIVARMTPGAIIEGTVRTETGEPLENAAVELWQWGYSSTTGERALVRSSAFGGHTDDRGRYRVYQLQAGAYIVATTGLPLRIDGPIPVGQQPTISLTHDEIDAMRRGLPPATTPSRHEARTTTYFPGVTRPAEAEVVVVAAGQERSRVDITMRTVPTASIRGRVVAPGGVKPIRTIMQLRRSADDREPFLPYSPVADRNDGTFLVTGVQPGDYVMTASMYLQTDAAPGTNVRGDVEPRLFGSTAVTVDGRDVNDVVISLQPGGTISGRVQFAGGPPPSEELSRVRLALAWAGAGYQAIAPPSPALIGADGRFVLGSVPPGSYVVQASSSGQNAWRVISAVASGIDVADVPLEINGQRVDDVIVAMSSAAATSLSGSVTTSTGQPAGDGWVIVFSTDRATWRPLARRVNATQVRADSRYTIDGLPAGDYFVIALPDVDSGRWYDPSFLQQLQSMSPVKITLAAGERKVQPLVMTR